VRHANNYRAYSEAAVERLELIRQGQSAGFTLREMRGMIHAWERDELSPEEKVRYFQAKLAEIDERIASLQRSRAYLEAKLARAEGAELQGPPQGWLGQRNVGP
jgi:DNA-binding transcriptional MerR regulator